MPAASLCREFEPPAAVFAALERWVKSQNARALEPHGPNQRAGHYVKRHSA